MPANDVRSVRCTSSPRAAVATARAVGARIGEELSLPVFLYAEACVREDRRKLGNIRNKHVATVGFFHAKT